MSEFFFDKNQETEGCIFLNIVPPKLEKHPLTLDITPIMATVLEFIVKAGVEQKVTFNELIENAKFLEGNQNLTEIKLRQVLEHIRLDLQRMGIVNGILILPNCAILKADIQIKNKDDSDDLLDFIYRDLVQDKDK